VASASVSINGAIEKRFGQLVRIPVMEATYEAPELQVLGTVADLTQSAGPGSSKAFSALSDSTFYIPEVGYVPDHLLS
jgi:hypothetical protein